MLAATNFPINSPVTVIVHLGALVAIITTATVCSHNHSRGRLYQSDLFRFSTIQCHGVIDVRSWSDLGKKDSMVSESPARSSHRPPQPTIVRLV